MGRVILTVIVVIGIASAIAFMATNQSGQDVAASSPKNVAAVKEMAGPPPLDTFSTTGTLVFYPNNVEPVPYIFYKNSNGNTVAKALVFSGTSPINFSWNGSHVAVAGTVDNEHIIVSYITYLSGP